jgi:hypothetical protein
VDRSCPIVKARCVDAHKKNDDVTGGEISTIQLRFYAGPATSCARRMVVSCRGGRSKGDLEIILTGRTVCLCWRIVVTRQRAQDEQH